jgi:DNA-binding transcriptional LysR family regulator
MKWSLYDLQLFIIIVESGSLSQASDRAHLAVSAMSARLKGLEDALGVLLMLRSSKGMTLTPAGHRLIAHSRELMINVQQINDDMNDYAQQAKGLVRIAANTTAVTEYLPGLLADAMSQHTRLEVSLMEAVSSDVVRAVREGRADLGVFTPGPYSEDLQVLPFRSDELVLITSIGHMWTQQESIDFAQTLVSDYVCLQRSSALFEFLVQRASETGLSLRSRIHVAGFEAAARMVEKGVGVAVIPRSAAVRLQGMHGLSLVRLTDDWSANKLHICLRDRDNLNASTQAVLNVLLA